VTLTFTFVPDEVEVAEAAAENLVLESATAVEPIEVDEVIEVGEVVELIETETNGVKPEPMEPNAPPATEPN
jgi:hypothetical protein